MKSKKKLLIFIPITIIIAVILFLLFPNIIWYEPSNDYRLIDSTFENELTKCYIQAAAEGCTEELFFKAAENRLSECSICYYDDIFMPEDIEVISDDDVFKPDDIEVISEEPSQMIIITYCTNEAKRKITDTPRDFFTEYLFNISLVRQRERVGVLYCSNDDLLTEYSKQYIYKHKAGSRFMTVPISDNIYYFIAEDYIK